MWRTPHTPGTPPQSHSRSPRAPHASHQPSARHARPELLAAQTTMSYRRTRPLVSFLRLNASQLSDFGRPRASNFNDTPYESEITTARLRLKSRFRCADEEMAAASVRKAVSAAPVR